MPRSAAGSTRQAAAVSSVRAQSRPALETLLVVDHNTALEERLRSQYKEADDVRVLPNAGPRGLSAGRNTGVAAARGEIDAVFADPARRGGRGRVFDPEAYSPPLSWALEAARHTPYAALKLAPGLPHEAVPAAAEAEWVSHRGEVKEAVLWFGTGRPSGAPPRRATLLPSGVSLTGSGLAQAPTGPPARYLYEPDGAVIRAHLVAEAAERLDGHLLDAAIAYVASDRPPATLDARTAALATAYEITEVLPFHVKRLRALLRERGIGTVTVKKRGSALTPEELLRRLKPQGPHAATVFCTRLAGRPAMLLGRPVERPAAGHPPAEGSPVNRPE